MTVQTTFSVTDNSSRLNRLQQPGRHLIIGVPRKGKYYIRQFVERTGGTEIPTIGISEVPKEGYYEQNVHCYNGRDYILKFQNQLPNIDICDQKWVSIRYVSDTEFEVIVPGQTNYSSDVSEVRENRNIEVY